MNPKFHLVDVFGVQNFSGNPLGVITGANHLQGHAMQRIARWLNLSETVFLLPPSTDLADYRARIFTLERELPFAGHPTLGSCRAWLDLCGVPRNPDLIVQECTAGLIQIRREPRLAFCAPALLRSGPVDAATRSDIASVLNIHRDAIIDAQWVDNGPGWVAVLLASAVDVLRVEPTRTLGRRIDVGIVGPHAPGGDAAFEIRAFFTDQHGTLVEDPITGSLNASVAQWLLASGRVNAPYTATQGTRLGRTGRVFIDADGDGRVWVGGEARILFSGEAHFDQSALCDSL